MFPQSSTNRYGDLLKEFYQGVKDGSLSEGRMSEIQRVFNELYDRELVYKSWISGNKIASSVLAGYPFLKAVVYQRIDPQTIPNDIQTDVLFDNSTADNLTILDAEKLRISYKGRFSLIGLAGTIQWEENGTGRRAIHANVYNSSDVLLFGQTLHSMPPTSVLDPTLPFIDVVGIGQDIAADYLKITVIQTSGGDLDINSARLTVFEMNT